jgi:hypothetical protein
MTGKEKQIHEKLRGLNNDSPQIFTAVVTEVDEDKLSCTVIDMNDVELFNVRMRPVFDDKVNGVYCIPEVGSIVTVGMIHKSSSSLTVLQYTKTSKVIIRGSEASIELQDGVITMNEGENGGLIKIEELKKELDKTNAVVNALKNTLLQFVPVPTDGGAALKTFATAQLGTKVTGSWTGIENKNVKH